MNLGNRISQHNFSQIPNADIPRSQFNRSHGRKQTFDADYLIPIYLDEVLPGDTHNLSMTCFARLATPITPFMDNLYIDYFFFFVPTRLVWDNWQKFNGEQKNPGDSTDFTIPLASESTLTVTQNTLQNYMGLPIGTFSQTHSPISALPFRCYNLIWREWFRDQNLQNSPVVDTDNGSDDPSNYVLLKRGKRHDYFTSALPWPQKGPSVELPLGTSAPVYGPNMESGSGQTNGAAVWQSWRESGSVYGIGPMLISGQSIGTKPNTLSGSTQTPNPLSPNDNAGGSVIQLGTKDNYETLIDSGWTGFQPPYADLTEATAATINQLREAFQIQRLYERDARGGTRYIEIIRSHFGVISPDARLQRPEYLGGGSSYVNLNPVPQTTQAFEGANSPQGNLAAYGTSTARGIGFQKSFVEHGYIIGLAAARADLSYQQGINKLWNRQTRFDFYWPTLSHLGEQAILNSEIYAQGTSADAEVFGYQERYAEYRYKPSEILGTFMSTATGSLDIWHLAQDFSALPALNSSFIQSNTPISRVIAVDTEPHFLFDAYFNLISARPMPTYSVPGMIDHF